VRDDTLIGAGLTGAVIAAVCCATPLLAIVFGAVGLTALAAKADYVMIPALILFLGFAGLGLHRKHLRQR